MSHIATIKVAFTEIAYIESACAQVGATFDRTIQTVTLFGSQKVTGRAVQLDGWKYPVVISPNGREVSYDNYNGRWGDITKLNQFKAAYSTAITLAEFNADPDLTSIRRTTLADGTIVVTADTLT